MNNFVAISGAGNFTKERLTWLRTVAYLGFCRPYIHPKCEKIRKIPKNFGNKILPHEHKRSFGTICRPRQVPYCLPLGKYATDCDITVMQNGRNLSCNIVKFKTYSSLKNFLAIPQSI